MFPNAASLLKKSLVESSTRMLFVSVENEVSKVFILSTAGIRSAPNWVASFIFLQELKKRKEDTRKIEKTFKFIFDTKKC
jgi:hypothetical protein